MNKKTVLFLFALFAFMLLASCSKEPAPTTAASDTEPQTTATTTAAQENLPSDISALTVKGTQLMNENGNPIQLRGVSTHGLSWYPDYVNKECFKQLKDEWNINTVRLAMYTAENGGYCTDGDKSKLKALVKNGVYYATECGLYVIIDWHILSDGNPNTYLEESKAFFEEMSKEYADHTNVIYEICNEPNGGTSWADVKAYANEVIPVIRQNDSDALILVGTPNWCQYVDKAAADPLTGYDNIMYTLHFYAATHKDDLRSTMTKAIEKGLPIFVSEFGICDASGSGSIDTSQADQWVSLMNKHNISYMAWNLSNKNESSALIKSDCSKTDGFTYEELSKSGQWLYTTLTGSKSTTASSAAEKTEVSENEASENTGDIAVSSNLSNSSISLSMTNSWEENGSPCKQYSLSIKNKAQKAQTGWKVTLDFGSPITLISSWNGKFSVSGSTLTITNADYNGTIPQGDTLGDIGFIIKL